MSIVKKVLAIVVPLIIIGVLIVVVVINLPEQPIEAIAVTENEPVVEVQKIQPALGASLIFVQGDVQYQTDLSGWLDVMQSIDLYEGYSVQVRGEGKAIINLDDGSALRLNSDSQVTLTSLNPQAVVISNDSGEVYTRVAAADRTFMVQAGDVIYESLGTAYNTINKEVEKSVEVYHNSVRVKQTDSETTVAEGKKYYIECAQSDLQQKVVDLSKEEIEQKDFIVWNKQKDEENYSDQLGFLSQEKTDDNEQSKQDESASGSLKLSATKVDNGIKLTWSVAGLDAPQGFKIVKSSTMNPVYPGNDYQYITNPDQRAYTWEIKDGKTYYFRVCQYLGGKCGLYSNNVSVTAPYQVKETSQTETTVSAISLTHVANGTISWVTNGYSAKGFKIVWSKNSGPTYPTRAGDKYLYFSDPQTTSGTVTAFDGSGTYYVRVCEYLGGKCGKYSNQIMVSLTSETEQSQAVNSINLTAGANASLSWTIDGYSAKGFKIVWSKNSGPTYPTRAGDKYLYYSDPQTTSGTLTAFDGSGTYYVRVCEYLGGKCGKYSNQITMDLQ